METRFVFLMHPHELKNVKAGTGRLTALCLKDAEIQVGIGFDDHEAVQALIHDPANYPMLLYPGAGARNVSEGGLGLADLGGRRLTVFLLDATWALAKKMLKLSPSLQALPRLMFTPQAKSRWIIKQQPHELCLSTLEAVDALLRALEAAGLDRYERPDQLLGIFNDLNAFQLACAADPERQGYRRRPYRPPTERVPPKADGRFLRGLFFKD